MNICRFNRRSFLATGAAAGALPLLPGRLLAAENLIAAVFGGSWSEVHRDILKPCFEGDTGATVSQSAMLASVITSHRRPRVVTPPRGRPLLHGTPTRR